ncbi:HAD-IIIC family phosphatase [Sphingomonas sp.]|uniref:HAD-IIIC family phosphatase n=1 Tax=Sphingomonas sp. TaxID=28214 RepID=UPI000DB1B6EB|nr:HAD-IIIC family phosphatase [Sphingomonas sp.]PZU06604.1 MAG: hypothetical protein DI605_18500 [Sphingomonas sp.]
MSVSNLPPARHRIAATLRAHRDPLIEALIAGTHSGVPRENRFSEEKARFSRRIGTWVDLMIGHVEGKAGYDALFAGQTVLEIHQPERPAEENRAAVARALDSIWIEIAGAGGLEEEPLGEMKRIFDDLVRGMRIEPRVHVRTLLVGDCLMGEIAGIAADGLARAAISFDPFPLNAREPTELNRQISRMANQGYDAVFFSPFSHARISEIEALLDPRRALQGEGALVEAVIEQTRALLVYLVGKFECPIYVHNAALVARASTPLRGAIRNGLTSRRRGRARVRFNTWLREFVDARNAAGARQLHIVDEEAIYARQGSAAGRYLYESDFQHATALSLALAGDYARRIEMLATLKGKKLVICDLDHTLWEGVIGEGSVAHFADRQASLRRLREKSGVVLTIASKNDPEKVHFSGGVLGMEDFVAPQISWGRKVDAVARLRQQLNLQYRHMVFVDDRPDERAFMAEAYPDMLVLDATDPETWARIALWADATEGSSDLDRTQLYQQQLERDSFVGEGDVSQLGEDVLAKLELKIEVREAGKSDLKRFAELINRTNQWNMTGARTTLERVKQQAGAADAILLLASARDKFGDMGDVCAATVTIADGAATIDAFVLSCRVFGYGVEGATLGAIREKAAARGAASLTGQFIPTAQNHMARDMYADNGFDAASEGVFRTAL